MNNKYEFTGETKIVFGHTVRRIRALAAIGASILPGDAGGWIESEHNLSTLGNAWVYDNAMVYGNAVVSGDALVSGNSDYMVFRNSWSSFRWFTYTSSNGMWKVGCFCGTGEELIARAYKDSELSGKCYEAIVRSVEVIEKAKDGGVR